MTIAFDAFSSGGSSQNPETWTHTPVGTPRGIIVFALRAASTTATLTVTYGGTGMTAVSGAKSNKTSGENSYVEVYFLGASVPTGAQTVSISGTSGMYGRCYSVTAADDTEINNTDLFTSDAMTTPLNRTLTLGGVESFVCEGLVSGNGTAGDLDEITGWTEDDVLDVGSQCVAAYSYDTIGTADVTYGYDDTDGDDTNIIAVAVSELTVASGIIPQVMHHRRMMQ